MTLVVEDGSGLSNANSYLSVVDCDTYHSLHGNTAWTGSTPVKEAALINATQYLNAKYNTKWLGTRINFSMSLAWPRYGVIDPDGWLILSNSLPQALKDATAEMALRALTVVPLVPDILNPGMLSHENIVIGGSRDGIQVEHEWANGQSQIPQYQIVEDLLRAFINFGTKLYRS